MNWIYRIVFDKGSYLPIPKFAFRLIFKEDYFPFFLREEMCLRHFSTSQYFFFEIKSQRVIKVEWIWGVQCGLHRRRSSVHLHYPYPAHSPASATRHGYANEERNRHLPQPMNGRVGTEQPINQNGITNQSLWRRVFVETAKLGVSRRYSWCAARSVLHVVH